jgi:hypothetical protein
VHLFHQILVMHSTGICFYRVAPIVEPRACRSANDHFESDDEDSPDPLEPWSTKKIANMNKILAWENDQDSM